MKVAIIGGGAAGMITAYLLDKAGFTVSVFEKEDILGGNIRTAQKNIHIPGLDEHAVLEGGVVEFSAKFHRFRRLMEELDVRMHAVDIGTGLYTRDGKAYLSKLMIQRNRIGLGKIFSYMRLLSLNLTAFSIWQRTRSLDKEKLSGFKMGDFADGDKILTDWLKNFSMYSYSIPFGKVFQMPAALTIPAIRDYMMADWYRIEGGVYSYIERIIDKFSGQILTGIKLESVQRTAHGVKIRWQDRGEGEFDKAVFACPPDQVLSLLKDAHTDEKSWFRNWQANHISTIIHTDDHFYRPFSIRRPSAFDFFQTRNGYGYNAYLNHLCGLSQSEGPSYFLSFNMEEYINPESIIHIQKHHTPLYTHDAYMHIEDIKRHNGARHCLYAGAYLGDGLHEGAVSSAEEVLRILLKEKPRL